MGFPRVFCDAEGKRTNAGDMLVSCLSARVWSVNQGGTADSIYSSLTDGIFLSRTFFFA